MEWIKYEELKPTLALGEVIVATFHAPESINRLVCTCCVVHDGQLKNIRTGKLIEGIEPDYAFVLTKPDQLLVSYFV